MNDNVNIQQLLDDVVHQKIDRATAEKTLTELGVENASIEVDAHLAAAKAIQRHNIIQQVQSVHLRFNDQTNHTKTNSSPSTIPVVKMTPLQFIVRVAASAILIMGLFIGYEYASTTNNDIYSAVYQPYEVNTSRSSTAEIPTHNMLELFRNKDYAAVIKTFETLNKTNNREKFLTAYALHEKAQYAEAVKLLESILQYNKENNSKLYNDEAEFYLGLNFLKMNNAEKAIQYLSPIAADSDHTFHERVGKWTLIKLKWLK